jgi:hypothetical protein
LFLSEVEFLNKVIELADGKEIWFVYAGASPGNHIGYLSELFPSVHFELYDPNDFLVMPTKMIKTHIQFFTDADAKHWATKNKFLVFCSDIRSEPATKENINRNMEMQLKWWQIMNPELAMFKFRLPWEEGETKYPVGEIYIQAFPGATSTETRLICKKGAELTTYDNKTYEEALFFHNTKTRMKRYSTVLGLSILSRDGIDACYDCSSFVWVMSEYLRVTGGKVTELRNLINNVQKKISFGKSNILLKSTAYFNSALELLGKHALIPCSNTECPSCMTGHKFKNPHKRKSKATIENEMLQLRLDDSDSDSFE